MKLNKYFLLGLAGLAFTACSNEEEVSNNPTFKGNGAVSVSFVNPLTRAAGNATADDDNGTLKLAGTIRVTLTGDKADGTAYSEYVDVTVDANTPMPTVKFWNIAKPEKITAVINAGKAEYVEADLASLQVEAAKIPAYGETEVFKLTANSDTPDMDEDGKTEAGAEAGDDEKDYQMYTATVTMQIPVARLEVGGIKHVTSHTDGTETCKYATLTIDGAYLDKVTVAGASYSDGYLAEENLQQNYTFDGVHGSGTAQSPLRDEIASTSFLAADAVFGTYTYNFYTDGKSTPIFKLFFENATANDPQNPVNQPRYAMITKYKNLDGSEISAFQPGHIYRIMSAELKDENIIGDEEGNTLYGVEVTVVEAVWTLHTIDAEWAQ